MEKKLIIPFGVLILIVSCSGIIIYNRISQNQQVLTILHQNPKELNEHTSNNDNIKNITPETLKKESQLIDYTEIRENIKASYYVSNKHNFEVYFPGEVELTEYGEEFFNLTQYTAIVEDVGAFNIYVTPCPKPSLLRHVDEVLIGAVKGLVEPLSNTELIRSDFSDFRGYKSIDYEYTIKHDEGIGYVMGTCFILDKSVCHISISTHESAMSIAYKAYNIFKESFNLLNR